MQILNMKVVWYPSFLSLLFAICGYYSETSYDYASRLPCRCNHSTSPSDTSVMSWNTVRRNEIAEIVTRNYPWASLSELPLPGSEYIIMKDARTAGCSRKGYFTMGYDTNPYKHGRIPGRFDFFVRFYNNHKSSSATSPYYFKPAVILLGLKGCRTNVNFVYKDTDVVMKKEDITYAFKEQKLSYQEEMYNSSANAGIILGKNTAKVRHLVELWNNGVGIADNIEQDQTILRSLVFEYPRRFERLYKNSVGTHLYSSEKNRKRNIAKFTMKQWAIFGIVYNALSFYAVYYTMIRVIASSNNCNPKIWYLVALQRRKHNDLTRKLKKHFKEIFFLVHMGLVLKILLGNPLFVAKSIGNPTLNDPYKYHLADHFLADDLTRIHCTVKTVFMSDTRNSFEIYNLLGISESFIITAADTLYLAAEFIPFSILALSMWGIFLSERYSTKSADSFHYH